MTDVVVIGGCNLDIKAKTLEPARMATSNPAEVTMAPGGVARNIAHNLARLGISVSLISAVGRDAMGEDILQATAAAGVDMGGVSRVDEMTDTYIAVLNRDGELVIASSAMAAVDHVTPEVIAAAAARLESARIVVSDCNLPLATLKQVAALCGHKLLLEPVSVAKSRKLREVLNSREIAYATPNLDQLESLAGTRDVAEAIDVLHGKGLRNVIVHAGSAGAYCSDGTSGVIHVPAISAGPVADVTGAGDGAVAGLVFGLLQGKTLAGSVAEGQALAGRIIASLQSVLE